MKQKQRHGRKETNQSDMEGILSFLVGLFTYKKKQILPSKDEVWLEKEPHFPLKGV